MKPSKRRKSFVRKLFKETFFLGVAFIIVVFALTVAWVASLDLPDFNNFENRSISNSTKIYDRTGENLLYDLHQDVKRTVIPFDSMGDNIKHARSFQGDPIIWNSWVEV